jgi:hypothetical protein
MNTWFISPNGATALTILIAIGLCLALLRALATQGLSARTIAASLLVRGAVMFGFGAALFTGRVF